MVWYVLFFLGSSGLFPRSFFVSLVQEGDFEELRTVCERMVHGETVMIKFLEDIKSGGLGEEVGGFVVTIPRPVWEGFPETQRRGVSGGGADGVGGVP